MQQTPPVTGVFWQQLAKSGLLSEDRTAAVARELLKRKVSSDDEAARLLVSNGLLTQYQADRLLEGRSRGFFFDKYCILDLLGAGGMGWVYRAIDTQTKEIVALKVLLDRLKEDRGMMARFQQESRAGMLLNHPNIVRTRATGSAGGMLYMIMDFVEGPSLLELLMRCRRLPWAAACDMARQAALGLHHAHQCGLVHRDVKPQNLLIDHQGHVKLLDFGLAMIREGDGGEEFSMAMIFGHECIGTPAFMAPEQATDSLTADARSDVYGLGCTLFAALTGDTPFPLRNPHDVIKAHQTQTPRNVCDIIPEIPAEVGAIVAKMLAKDPADRYQTAAEAAKALSKWAKQKPVHFDFAEILAERTQSALERVAELHKSRPVPSGSASSTTRLSKLSSVAQRSSETAFGPGKSPRLMCDDERRDALGERVNPGIISRLTNPSNESAESRPKHRGKVLTPQGGGPAIPLTIDKVSFGRAEENDVQIPDASVSGKHCELQFDGAWWWITDLKSRNGTRVNGKTVTRRQIVDGDVISIGNNVRLKFESAREDSRNSAEPTKTIPWLKIALIIALVGAAGAIGLIVAMN